MIGRRIVAGALGAHLLTHTPEAADAAPKSAVAVTPPARPTRIDAGGGAVAFLVESHEIPLVDLSISFRSGSALEPAQKVGLTRLMGRMLRRGAVGWTSDKIEETIDLYGGEISVDVSASSINVHAQVIRRNLEPFVKLVTALLTTPSFPKDELERLQREAVAEIIEARDHDKSVASKFFREAVFGKHPYGRGTTGTTKSIPSITREDIVAAHALHFKRGNIVLGIAGDLTADEAKTIVFPLVAAFPQGAGNADPTPDPVFPKGRKLVFVDKPARTQTQILIGAPGTHANDPDHTALHVANTVFGGTFTARLMKEVRSKRGWSYGAYARLPIDRRREAFSMWTFPAATDAPACIALEIEMLEELVKNGITDQELGFAKSYLSESYAFDVDTAYKRVRQAVDEEIYSLPADYHTAYVKKILAVTKPEADAALAKRISTTDFVVIVVGTASELKAKIEKSIPGLTSSEVVPFDAE
ncbi:MAG: M16 family metallopeptidase [Polyangiales bacterium]